MWPARTTAATRGRFFPTVASGWHFAESPLLVEPGTEYHYSSYGWILLGAAIAGARFRSARDARHRSRLRSMPTPDRAVSYFPKFAEDLHTGKLLQRDTVGLLQTSQRLVSREATGCGLGWDLETVTLDEPPHAAGHNGETLGGMVASLLTFPAHRMMVSVTSNWRVESRRALRNRQES